MSDVPVITIMHECKDPKANKGFAGSSMGSKNPPKKMGHMKKMKLKMKNDY